MTTPEDQSKDITLHDVMMHMQKGFEDIRKEMRNGFEAVDKRFSQMEKRFDKLAEEVRAEASACDTYKEKMNDLEEEELPKRMKAVERKLAGLAA